MRPSLYTPEVATEICEKLSQGIPLAEICRGEGMPAVRTVSDWKRNHDGFAAAFAQARDDGFDALAAQCLNIADDSAQDFIEGVEVTPGTKAVAFNAEHVQRSKLRVETRLKLLAKWDPKRYGELQKVEHSGEVKISLADRMRNRAPLA